MLSSLLSTRTPTLFGRLDDEAWLQTILGSLTNRKARGVVLPGFPPETVQRNFVGSAGEHALREGFGFYRVVRDAMQRYGRPPNPGTRVLDFGCGWGRMLRFFLREVSARNLHGVDVDPEMVSLCRAQFGPLASFDVVPPRPPAPTLRSRYDVIYLYSVFSHLSPEVHLAWVEEFARRLEPGGLLLATTQGRRFLDFCESLRTGRPPESPWQQSLAGCFPDHADAVQRYDRGELLFEPTGGGDYRPSTFYGEAVVPRGFVERSWPRSLTLVEFRDDPGFLPQALIVARKV
jgi:SAM-dependent methyltransferase